MIRALDEMKEAVAIGGYTLAEWADRGAWCVWSSRAGTQFCSSREQYRAAGSWQGGL